MRLRSQEVSDDGRRVVVTDGNEAAADAAVIRGVRVYRRKRGEGTSGFRLLSFVTGTSSYFDATIESGTSYEYVLTAVRTDGIEGPGSAVALF